MENKSTEAIKINRSVLNKIKGRWTRLEFIRTCLLGTALLFSFHLLGGNTSDLMASAISSGPERLLYQMDQNWLFGGKLQPGSLNPEFNDKAFTKITLPHCVTKLSWQKWDAAEWQNVWVYRRHFDLPEGFRGKRIFLNFEGVMAGLKPVINGRELKPHLGGYLPARYEVTDLVKDKGNVLAVEVDSRWLNVPPDGASEGAKRIDYLEPGGIIRSVSLEAVSESYISDVFANPVDVLKPGRKIELTCTVDAKNASEKEFTIVAELLDKNKVVAGTRKKLRLQESGSNEVSLSLSNLGKVRLWDVDDPYLYKIAVTLLSPSGKALHSYRFKMGIREAKFELDGFYLNGRRLQIFGLNRHEIYPYSGFAMPSRVMRRDAEILKNEYNCNMVRCSHYPQTESFLEACDELGLLVWEEVPGWGYIGDEAWKQLHLENVHDMIIRDRNHPSIVIWGDRVNESQNDVELYRKSRAIAKSLDDSRPTSGSMTSGSIKTWQTMWHEDVFAYDDYHATDDNKVGIIDPVPGFPFMLAEAVGQYNYSNPKEGFNAKYRRGADVEIQEAQALRHAEAHSKSASNKRNSGVIAWCAFDYSSLVNSYDNIKYPGIADVFRIPKLGASFYQTQVSPEKRPLIKADFYWDFGEKTPGGPGKNAAIFSNCDRLEVFINGKKHSTLYPDKINYPNIKYPPFFADLELDGSGNPELRIDGYVGGKLLVSQSYSSDKSKDKFILMPDDKELMGDGIDATRLVFMVTDKFGNPRLYAGGKVDFKISGPGEIVGDNPFNLTESGGAAAVWVKTAMNGRGKVSITANHSGLGSKTVEINVKPSHVH